MEDCLDRQLSCVVPLGKQPKVSMRCEFRESVVDVIIGNERITLPLNGKVRTKGPFGVYTFGGRVEASAATFTNTSRF